MTAESIDFVNIVITAVITGGVSTLSTIAALNVHINYLRETTVRLETAIIRAHDRIDSIEKREKTQ